VKHDGAPTVPSLVSQYLLLHCSMWYIRHRITCKQLSSRLPVIVTASLQTAGPTLYSWAVWQVCGLFFTLLHDCSLLLPSDAGIAVKSSIISLCKFLYSKSCYLSSSYGYYHKYILSLISSRPINFKTMIPAMQTKTWLMTSKKEYVCHVTKISEQTMHYFYTFAQFEPWCWSDMAFPVFFLNDILVT